MGQRGMARNLVGKFASGGPQDTREGPRDMIVIESAGVQGGVYENEPVVRTDVYREDPGLQESISVRETRQTRELWARKEQEPEQLPRATPEVRGGGRGAL